MSSLNPKGIPVEINGETRHLLFDYNIIAEIQEQYDSSVIGVIRNMFRMGNDLEINASLFIGVLRILLEGERDRNAFFGVKDDLRGYTLRELGYVVTKDTSQGIVDKIMEAWGISLPKQTEEDIEEAEAERELAEAEGRDPNRKSGKWKRSMSQE